MARPESPGISSSSAEPVASTAHYPDRAVVLLHGEHDIATISGLSAVMARAIGDDDVDVVIDLADVRFMDASTIGVIVRATGFLRAESRTLTVRSPSPAAERLLHLCDLADLIDATTADALPLDGALATWVEIPPAVPDHRVRRPTTVAANHLESRTLADLSADDARNVHPVDTSRPGGR